MKMKYGNLKETLRKGCIRMKQKNLYLTVGIPGVGKSTWVRKMFDEKTDLIVSRDIIRFAILEEYNEIEDYFKYEDQVWAEFINKINVCLADENIDRLVVDATHLNPRSREKVLQELNLSGVQVNILCFNIPLQIALERNANRTGLAKVPDIVIKRMFRSLILPTDEEIAKWHLNVLNVDTTVEV